ncbi:protein KTI12 [Nematocida minor]|uniref:protein KTI12 n=1 Tax=Nematocida minor TaxID=1912983 RepID=UPI002220C4EB|nr:protein KTI12 [Nematocida minor]KAI5188979.1 protein KTI12 [Nematocida minor]
MLSGLPSPQKKTLFHFLLAELIKAYKGAHSQKTSNSGSLEEPCEKRTEDDPCAIDSVLVVLQNAVGVNAREETAKMRSIIQNKLSKRVLVLIYAPLHIKGLRYEISSTAKNMGIDTAHVYCAAGYQEGGEIRAEEVENMHREECSAVEVHAGGEKTETFEVVSRIFEKPRKTDKWDTPCFVVDAENINMCAQAALEKACAVMQKSVRPRTSSKKLIAGPLNTEYLQKVKEIISSVLEEKKKTRNIPLKISRQAEIDFISSIQMTPPPVEKTKEIYAFFLEKYLN